MSRTSLPGAYFDRLYEAAEDPWGFATSGYERAKYEATVAALGKRRFERGLEVGCSIGVLTGMLADHCDELLAVDVSRLAVERARDRLSQRGNVRVERMTLPGEMPSGNFDLIVCSEVLYYWDPEDLDGSLASFERCLSPGGLFVAVHWRPPTVTYPMQGDEVHEMLRARLRLKHVREDAEPLYRLDVYEAVAPADRANEAVAPADRANEAVAPADRPNEALAPR